MPNNLSGRIKSGRLDCGLSQEELAKACQVSQSTVANWERGGHIPRQATLSRIATALNVEEIWLLSGEHSANHGPVNSYLNTPIRHVPVYDWPKNAQDFAEARPQRYITMTVDPDNVFALLAPKSGTEFSEGTVLTFTRNYGADTAGLFLVFEQGGTRLESGDLPADFAEARLIFSLTPH